MVIFHSYVKLPEGNHRSDHISVFPWTFRTKDRLEGDLHLHVLVGIQVARPAGRDLGQGSSMGPEKSIDIPEVLTVGFPGKILSGPFKGMISRILTIIPGEGEQ